MNTHWLVLTNYGWQAFENEQDAIDIHCENINMGEPSYLVRGHTVDASGSDLDYALIRFTRGI